jgi:hypothetical protein
VLRIVHFACMPSPIPRQVGWNLFARTIPSASAFLVDSCLYPLDGREVHTVLVDKESARIHRGSLGPLGHTHATSLQIGRLLHGFIRANIYGGVPDDPHREHWYCRKRFIAL